MILKKEIMEHFLDNIKCVKGLVHKCNGYFMFYCPEHPHVNREGYVYLHRLVKEIDLERFLRTDEEVHHRDENRSNNNLSNLVVLSKGEHRRQHILQAMERRTGIKTAFVEDVCKDCGTRLSDRKVLMENMRRCVSCSHIASRKVKERPSVEELKEMCKTLPRTQIAKIYGVSETAVRKWIGLKK